MIDTDKNLWRENWLGCINELTSIELQKKTWLDINQTNPHWSFVEFMCCYFDDLYIDENYKNPLEKGWLTQQEFEIIANWHSALDKYKPLNNDDYDHIGILNDPKWLEIVKVGLLAKRELMVVLNEKERNILETL